MRKISDKSRIQIGARVSPQIKEKLNSIANGTNSSLSDTIENVITNGLNNTGIPQSENSLEASEYSLDDLVSEITEIRKRSYKEGVADTINEIKNNPDNIDFVGGSEQKSEDDEDDEEDEDLECGSCGAEITEEDDFCPDCNEELDWDNEGNEEKGWLSGLIGWNNGG